MISDFRDEYTEDNLPIDVPMDLDLDVSSLNADEKIFYEQLNFISLSRPRINLAICDYHRALKQRSRWIRNELVYIDELTKYEEKLIYEWKNYYLQMIEELDDNDLSECEKSKMKSGKKLFNNISEKDFKIRDRCSDPFIMRGTYHMLANKSVVGWHMDFVEKIKELLSKGVINETVE